MTEFAKQHSKPIKVLALFAVLLAIGCASPIVQSWCGKIIVGDVDVFPCVEEVYEDGVPQ